MANHVHILIYPEADLSKITKSIKNFSARQSNAILERTGQPFWQDESYDHWVRGPGNRESRSLYRGESGIGRIGRQIRRLEMVQRVGDRPGGPSYSKLSRTTVSRW